MWSYIAMYKSTRYLYESKMWKEVHSFFYKNHAFQNEARLFLIFFQNRGSIVLNLFLSLTTSLKKKQRKKKQNVSTITFSLFKKKLYSSRLQSFIFLFSFSLFTFSFTFLLFFLSQIWGSLFLIVLNFEQKWGSLFL